MNKTLFIFMAFLAGTLNASEVIYRICTVGDQQCEQNLSNKTVLKTMDQEPGWDPTAHGNTPTANLVTSFNFLDPSSSTACPEFSPGTKEVWAAMAAGQGGRVSTIGWLETTRELSATSRAMNIQSDIMCDCVKYGGEFLVTGESCSTSTFSIWRMVADVD